MARGGYRVGAGRPRKGEEPAAKLVVDATKPVELKPGDKTPLEYMLAVMNDTGAEQSRRDRMAIAAAPFVHGRASEQGKKETLADAAKAVAESGRFMTSEPPSHIAH
jgi:Mg-chelatase subunit ChlD